MTCCPPIFLVGFPSTGTTLLRNILWSHPQFFGAHETNFYVEDYRTPAWFEAIEKYMLGDLARSGATELVADCPEYSMPYLRELAERCPDRRAFVGSFFEAVRKYSPGKTWIEKTPRHLVHLDAIKRDFPESRIVHITRDPRDTTLSIAKRGWFRGGYREACGVWRDLAERFAPIRNLVDYELSYEDLCLQTETTLGELFESLGVSYSREDETFAEVLSGPDYARCPIFSSLGPVVASAIGRHAREWSIEHKQAFGEICGPAAARLGWRPARRRQSSYWM